MTDAMDCPDDDSRASKRNQGSDSPSAAGTPAAAASWPITPPPNSEEREPGDPLYSDDYYEFLERAFGPEKAAWARLPRAQRREELKKIHEQYDTPDDLDPIPPELGGGVWNP
jgi:hypothetical protein